MILKVSSFQAISKDNSDVNFVVSPFSIWSLMILLAEGATDESLRQLRNVLYLPNSLNRLRSSYRDLQEILLSNTSTVGLSLNQALFSDENSHVNNNFVDILLNDYRANHLHVNFQKPIDAANSINNFIRSQTHGKIENIVNAHELINTNLLLSSSIFFNGQWKVCFVFHSTNNMNVFTL